MEVNHEKVTDWFELLKRIEIEKTKLKCLTKFDAVKQPRIWNEDKRYTNEIKS